MPLWWLPSSGPGTSPRQCGIGLAGARQWAARWTARLRRGRHQPCFRLLRRQEFAGARTVVPSLPRHVFTSNPTLPHSTRRNSSTRLGTHRAAGKASQCSRLVQVIPRSGMTVKPPQGQSGQPMQPAMAAVPREWPPLPKTPRRVQQPPVGAAKLGPCSQPASPSLAHAGVPPVPRRDGLPPPDDPPRPARQQRQPRPWQRQRRAG